MITYRIGAQAGKIIALRIDLAGRVTPILRQRDRQGDFVSFRGTNCDPINVPEPFEFIVRVVSGHSGTIEILPGARRAASSHSVIPLGPDLPVLESEIPPSPGAAGAGFQDTQITFRFEQGRLGWRTNNTAGSVNLDAGMTFVTVALRLAPENDGEISLAPHLLLRSSDRFPSSELTVSPPLIRAPS